MFTDPSSDERLTRKMPASRYVWPDMAMSASGGYAVHPELAAPAGTKKLASMTAPPARYARRLAMFSA